MKSKKIFLVAIISILILTISTTSYALTRTVKNSLDTDLTNSITDNSTNTTKNETKSNTKNETKNTAKNEAKNTVKNEAKNTVKNEAKNTVKNEAKNTVKNETKNTTKSETKNTVSKDTTNSVTLKDDDKTEKENVKDDKADEEETINEEVVYEGDLSEIKSDKKTVYENVTIEGNAFIIADEIKFSNSNIEGDLFVIANKVTVENSTVEGSVYICADSISLDIGATSLYLIGDKIELLEDTAISRELRGMGNSIVISGTYGKDVYAYAEKVTIEDKTKISGECIIKASDTDISESAKLASDAVISDYDTKTEIILGIVSTFKDNITIESRMEYYIYEKGAEILIIIIIAIIILAFLPKFVDANRILSLKNFIAAFFVGILTFIIVGAIFIGLSILGYGIGYALALLTLTIILALLGKAIFIIAFAMRLATNRELKNSKVKTLIYTIFVAVVIDAIGLLAFAGTAGIVIVAIFNAIIGISGFGTIIKCIFTTRKKISKVEANTVPTNVVTVNSSKENEKIDTTPVQNVSEASKVDEEKVEEEKSNQAALQEEIKNEIREEIKELQDEKEAERKLQEEAKKLDPESPMPKSEETETKKDDEDKR